MYGGLREKARQIEISGSELISTSGTRFCSNESRRSKEADSAVRLYATRLNGTYWPLGVAF